MTISRNGIYNDLSESTYVTERNGMRYYFSSPVNKRNYDNRIGVREVYLNDALSARFRMNFDATLIADLQMYATIEKRGYRVVRIEDETEYTSWQQLSLTGRFAV